ncbi:cation:proton antiporter [Gordonia alkaliphila]|uniref:cation:proton antiporter n=1 Tax=Gordonia alkaliphila TaxID=1053547 RepID=UPI001FF4952F|nr:cation:proton antiporter [Gordonia alkaliphila]MCK0438972.1 cation:proton antiporter [Gordonia alkaliphila]
MTAATLVLVPLLAVLAPIITRGLRRWVVLPVIVFELLLGIVVGPSVLELVEPVEALQLLSEFGVAMLFFMAGTEINAAALRGRTGARAGLGWLLSLAIGIGMGWILVPGVGAVIIGIALSSTALGTLIPVLRDNGDLHSPFGRAVGAIGTVGEFGPIVAISVMLSNRSTLAAILVLVAFGVLAVLAIWRALRLETGKLHRFVESTLHTSAQFAVRLVLLIVAALVALSAWLDVDILLGAFTAGIIWHILIRDADPETQEAVESKIEGLAFGFLIPIFFIVTGIEFDLDALLEQPWTLALLPVVALALFVARGLPSALAAPEGSDRRTRLSVALMGATGLPIIIVATTTGVAAGYISATAAAVLVGGGMLSVLLFPALATVIRAKAPSR